jgi:hypothetical protein
MSKPRARHEWTTYRHVQIRNFVNQGFQDLACDECVLSLAPRSFEHQEVQATCKYQMIPTWFSAVGGACIPIRYAAETTMRVFEKPSGRTFSRTTVGIPIIRIVPTDAPRKLITSATFGTTIATGTTIQRHNAVSKNLKHSDPHDASSCEATCSATSVSCSQSSKGLHWDGVALGLRKHATTTACRDRTVGRRFVGMPTRMVQDMSTRHKVTEAEAW